MSAYRVEFAIGGIIFREGDAATSAYLVESGTVEVCTTRDGAKLVLSHLGPGDLLGEMAVIDDAPRTATALALTDCVLTPVDRTQLNERLAQADPIVRALLHGQLRRYRSALARFRNSPDGSDAAPPQDGFDESTDAVAKIRLEGHLREALESRNLQVHLQPIYEIAKDRVAGYEALTRWVHPDRGPVSPAEFIALAEETSLIVPVGEYVLHEVCAALRALADRGATPAPFIAVNVSGRQLADPALIERVIQAAREHGVDYRQIKIEITESLVLDYAAVQTMIERCHSAGILVALDDFGTGYSNLGHLHELAFDTVKLDQGFTRKMDQPRALAIVRAIVAMTHALGCDMVAEGVETPAQLEQLRDLGCRYAQGYLVGKPAPLAGFLAK